MKKKFNIASILVFGVFISCGSPYSNATRCEQVFTQEFCSALVGRDGKDGDQGERGYDGINGRDGTACHVIQANVGAIISCDDGSEALITNGLDGEDGIDGVNGKDGPSCSVLCLSTQAVLYCPDGTRITFGTNCKVLL